MFQQVPPFRAATPVPPEITFEPCFSSDGVRFLTLLINGGLLQLVTFGFYRFWFLTDIRRHLWSATSIDGDAFEYTGRARELLIGFLFALAVLAPFFFLYFLAGLEAERYKAFASVPLYLALYLFGQYATYRARRYRLTRTIWRGVRFWMTGSAWAFVWRSALWSLATALSFGLAYPWRVAALERYKMDNTYYGDLPGRFVGKGWGLAKSAFPIWLILVVVWGAAIAVLIGVSIKAAGHGLNPNSFATFAPLLAAISVAFLATVIAWPIYQAIEWRWWIEGVRFGDVEAVSALTRGKIFGLYFKTFLWNVAVSLIAGLLIGLVVGVAHGAGAAVGGLAQQYVTIGATAVSYLLMLTAYSVVSRYYLQHQLWAVLINSTRIRNLDATTKVSARGVASNAFGEGLLDGLDMGGF